jgi:hypothetical protein
VTVQPRPSNPQTWNGIEAALLSAGFRYGDGLDIGYAVICAESGKDAGITGPINADGTIGNTDGSIDRGLCQINSKAHPEVTDDEAYDPVLACVAMRRIYLRAGKSFAAWAAFTSGAWKRYLQEAQLARTAWQLQVDLTAQRAELNAALVRINDAKKALG